MNIELFIKQMNGEHKDGIIEKHIVRQYVPLEEKIAEAKKIVNTACYTKVIDPTGVEKNVFRIDTVQKEFLTFLTLIKLYTDLDLSENPLKDYNTLAEKKYTKKLIGAMPEDARDFNTILNMVFDDEVENVTSIGNIINRLLFSSDSALAAVINEIVSRSVSDGEENQGGSE